MGQSKSEQFIRNQCKCWRKWY